MKTDIIGKIRNTELPKSKPLYPLFEAVSNAIHAIEDAKRGRGNINIVLFRATEQPSLFSETTENTIGYLPFKDIVIEDNGLGFDDTNFESFQTAETIHKIDRGSKGVGRFVWLKGFESVEIKSQFQENKSWKIRTFEFVPIDNGIAKATLNDSPDKKLRTVVHLRNMQAEIQKVFPKTVEEIAEQIIYHFMTVFIRPDCPQISIGIANESEEKFSVNDLFSELVAKKQINHAFTFKNQTFQIIIVKNYSQIAHNTVSYCAAFREVKRKKLTNDIPDFHGRLEDNDKRKFVYQTYVSGEYLNQNVNAERTEFKFPEKYDADEINFTDAPSLAEVHSRVIDSIETIFEDWLMEVRKEKEATIRQFITHEAPQYAPLLKYENDQLMKKLPANLVKDKLDSFLHTELHLLEKKNREQVNKFLNKDLKDVRDIEAYANEFNKYIEQVNDFGKSQLARYIVHRHTILRLLDKQFGLNEEGKYSLEETIHNTIFPIRKLSDEVTFETHNLWMIDERLAYHLYLASDKRLDSIDYVQSESADRLDLLIFQQRFALSTERDTPQSIVIVEFKRPNRNDYADNEKDNPISQVYRYITELRKGGVKDRRGEFIKLPNNTPFYVYIVADETPSFSPLIEIGDFTASPDGLGHFKYHDKLNAYVEIISYRKLLKDAKQRNRVLFDKLGLPII
jgi:hypothetical protein